MLPSRLFRNTGIPPKFRHLITPNPTLPPAIAVQLRLRLAVRPSTVQRLYSSSPDSHGEASSSVENSAAPESPALTSPQPPLEPKLSLTFTCTVKDCGTRSTHQFTKRAYTSGIVLIQCPGCKNRHLIADHLGWFKDDTKNGQLRTIEDILREKGEKVRRGKIDTNGIVEYSEV